MHTHHEHEGSDDDRSLRGRIKGISWANTSVGVVELAAGLIGGNSTLSMAGAHDISDGALYELKYRAACETDPVRKKRLRQYGAGALMGATLAFGAYEINQSLSDEHHAPSATTVGIGVAAATVNIGAAFALHRHRDHEDARDSIKHVVGADLPAALITLIALPVSMKYPEINVFGTEIRPDTIGTLGHIALATAVGTATLKDINRKAEPASKPILNDGYTS